MRELSRTIVSRVIQKASVTAPDSIQVLVLPGGTAWYIESGIIDVIRQSGFTVVQQSGSPLLFEFGMKDAGVTYSNVRKEGIFGPKLMDRAVRLQLTVHVLDRRSGRVLVAEDYQGMKQDTMEVSAVSLVENPSILQTQGRLPGEGFFSNLVEPLILVGALGVAVILLFHVRS